MVFSCEASLSSCNLTGLLMDSQLAIFNFAATYRPLTKKPALQNVSHFYQGVQNSFSKQEIELCKEVSMVLHLLFHFLKSCKIIQVQDLVYVT